MTNEEIDHKSEIVTLALYRLKERDYVARGSYRTVRAIDDMLAIPAEALADLYDLIRFHEGPEKE